MDARKSTDVSTEPFSDAIEQVLRLFTILHLVGSRRDGQRMGRAHLARACECSTKTVSRAVQLLREAQIPLDYDDVDRTYTFALQADETTPFAEQTRVALEKITVGMPPALRQLLEQTTQALQTSGGMARDYSRAPLRAFLAAAAQRQTIKMLYDSRNSGRCERRLVDPYVVEMRDRRYWEMQAWCYKDERVKTLALDRVLAARRKASARDRSGPE